MPIRHQVTDSDTVEYLAHQYLGSAARWRDIVDYNNLIYPYLSKNPEDKYKIYADGFVRITRASSSQPLLIQKYWTLHTRKSIMSSTIKTYYIASPVLMEAGQTEAYAFIRSLVPGIQGNTSEGSVTELGEDFEKNSIRVEVVNEQPITGGMEGVIKVSGDYLFIPNVDDTQLLTDYDVQFSYDEVRYFYGDDLKIVDDDLFVDSTQDLGTVNYLENVKQAVNRRFTTERGEILTDFNFGNAVSEIIGDNRLPFEAKERLIKLEIINCLRYEDRIAEPEITRFELVPSERACYADVTMKVIKVGSELKFENVMIGGNG